MKTIIKYKNRKLYDKDESTYIAIPQLVSYPLGSFKVIEHGTGRNVTEYTLLSALALCNRDDAKNIMRYLLKEST